MRRKKTERERERARESETERQIDTEKQTDTETQIHRQMHRGTGLVNACMHFSEMLKNLVFYDCLGD